MRGVILLATLSAFGADTEFEGKLERRAYKFPAPRWRAIELKPAPAALADSLAMGLGAAERVWSGGLAWNGHPQSQRAFLVDRGDFKVLGIDINGDGAFQTAERRVMQNTDDSGMLLWDLPVMSGPFPTIPVRFHAGDQLLRIDDSLLLKGAALVRGEQLSFTYEYDLDQGASAPRMRSVFRAGDKFLSTTALDLANFSFRLRLEAAESYTRIELTPGVIVPDFRFVDFSGAERTLHELRGKWVLLDFWGSWCLPCLADLPKLKALYEKYRGRGFEILGMTNDENLDAAKKVMADRGGGWTNATTESVKELIAERFRIASYPTLVLLKPDGSIYWTGEAQGVEGLTQVLELALR